MRARINGIVTDLDEAPKLVKNKKHRIEVVVDRFKVRSDLQLRLAESFETALRLTQGIAIIHFMDGEHEFDLLEHTLAYLETIEVTPPR